MVDLLIQAGVDKETKNKVILKLHLYTDIHWDSFIQFQNESHTDTASYA